MLYAGAVGEAEAGGDAGTFMALSHWEEIMISRIGVGDFERG